jgi:folate-binding protein YgfZ
VPRSSPGSAAAGLPEDYAAARQSLGHRVRSGALAVEGADREAFLQGQLTQDVRGLAPGASRLAAGLTPKGKLLYFGRLVAEQDRLLLLLPAEAVAGALAHLAKYAVFQKASVRDVTADYVRIALYGPQAGELVLPAAAVRMPPEWDLAGEVLAPRAERAELLRILSEAGSVPVSAAAAEALRVEAGRPRLHRDADLSHLPEEAGLGAAISANKGCYVGQEIVARMRTYGRANRRLVGFRFPPGTAAAEGMIFPDPEKPQLELARVTSAVVSPRLGPIGLGYAFREVPDGTALPASGRLDAGSVVVGLPFA